MEAEKTESIVEGVKVKSEITFNQIMGAVHASWLVTQGMVRTMGGTIQTVFRTVIGTTLGAISTLKPIFAAEAAAGDYVRAALGMASIAASIAALITFQQQQTEISDALRGLNMSLHGIQALLGGFHF